MQARDYVHGYSRQESARLEDQASTLEALLHADSFYPAGSRVLEVGCGVGAQTVPLARHCPDGAIVAVDVSAASIAAAAARADAAGLRDVEFVHADIFDLPFEPASFDHLFICFVLEHLPRPLEALRRLMPLLRAGGTVTVIEGDHGSTCLHPDSDAARKAVGVQAELQRAAGGDANIGRRLYPLLVEAGFDRVRVSPRMVYVDGSRPALAEGFTRRTFAAMIEGVRDAAVGAALIDRETFDAGVRSLYRAAEPDGVFAYTFFKAIAVNPA